VSETFEPAVSAAPSLLEIEPLLTITPPVLLEPAVRSIAGPFAEVMTPAFIMVVAGAARVADSEPPILPVARLLTVPPSGKCTPL
jgi:hypothetical protein